MEIWKDIEGYEGLYQVSNYGRVKSQRRPGAPGGVIKTRPGNSKYLMAQLCKNGKYKHELVHRLVAQAFLENPQRFPEVNHKDENRLNNHAENLEWCDRIYNCHYGTGIERMGKAHARKVLQYTSEGVLVAEYESLTAAAKAVNGFKTGIYTSCIKTNRKHCGYFWRYKI